MVKSRWLRILLKILLIWLVISIYFYFQHPVIYRCRDINASIPIGDGKFIIEEINVHNYDEDKHFADLMENKIPWQYRLGRKLDIPPNLFAYIDKAAQFYSWPPLAKEFGTLQVYGSLIYPYALSDNDFDTPYKHLDFSIYPTGGSGRSLTKFFKNAYIINNHGAFYFDTLDEPLIITVTDKETTKETQIILTPNWQKERLLKRGFGNQNPRDPVSRFISHIYNGNPQEALKYLMPERKKNILIPSPKQNLVGKNVQTQANLEWIDVYEGYYGVYRIDAEIGEYPGENSNNLVPQDRMTFYVHKDTDGNYKIIACQHEEEDEK